MKQDMKTGLAIDFIHRTIAHHVMWFEETKRQMGEATAHELLDVVLKKSLPLQLKKLQKIFGFELDEHGMPASLSGLSDEQQDVLLQQLAKNWLANDGIWFQAIEFSRNMEDAKRSNDSCWAQFSPFEAMSVKRLLGLPKQAGLEGLAKAMEFRMYAFLNKQSVEWEGSTSLVFRMNECRVQLARGRKGLVDYPCKSGGVAEFSRFAETIDSRIQTTCIACPPDKHPKEWFCAWRFELKE